MGKKSRCTAMLVGLWTLIQTGHRPEKSTGISIRVSLALDRSAQAFSNFPKSPFRNLIKGYKAFGA